MFSSQLASADEVHVNELPATSASEDDALEPSRYSLRRLTRFNMLAVEFLQ